MAARKKSARRSSARKSAARGSSNADRLARAGVLVGHKHLKERHHKALDRLSAAEVRFLIKVGRKLKGMKRPRGQAAHPDLV